MYVHISLIIIFVITTTVIYVQWIITKNRFQSVPIAALCLYNIQRENLVFRNSLCSWPYNRNYHISVLGASTSRSSLSKPARFTTSTPRYYILGTKTSAVQSCNYFICWMHGSRIVYTLSVVECYETALVDHDRVSTCLSNE